MKCSADISKAIDTLSVRRGSRPAFEKLNDQINHIKVSYKNRNQILKHTHTQTEKKTMKTATDREKYVWHTHTPRKPTPLKVLINKVLERQVHTHTHTHTHTGVTLEGQWSIGP